MSKSEGLKMTRQLQIYNCIASIRSGAIYSPAELTETFGITRRMLQRDLKDIRDCGLIKIKYNKTDDRYILDGDAVFEISAPPRRRQHLMRLYRIGTLIRTLSRVDIEALESYEEHLEEFNEFVEETKDDPDTTPASIEAVRSFMIPDELDLPDIKEEYYTLFPDSNERTRQRDFEEMNRAGFCIYYSRKHKAFIYEYSG
jgi:hypothetical protein